MIVGAVIAFLSYQVGATFHIFLYVGIAFVVFGIAKLIFRTRVKDKDGVAQHYNIHPVQHQSHKGHLCPKCRYVLHTADNFCRNCGNQVK